MKKYYKGFDVTANIELEEGKTYHAADNKLFYGFENPIEALSENNPGSSFYYEVELHDICEGDSNDTKTLAKTMTIGKELSGTDLFKAHFEYMKNHCAEKRTNSDIHNKIISTGDKNGVISAAGNGSSIFTGLYGTAVTGNFSSAYAKSGGKAIANEHSVVVTEDTGIAVADQSSIAVAGSYSIAVAGTRGSAKAEDDSCAAVKNHGHAIAGNRSVAVVGEDGVAIAGIDGIAAAGEGGTAIAGNYGCAAAGTWGDAQTGDYGTSATREGGMSTTGYRGCAITNRNGSASAGKNGMACALGGQVKGTLGCCICAAEIDGSGQIISVASGIVDGDKIKPDTWYYCENGFFVPF